MKQRRVRTIRPEFEAGIATHHLLVDNARDKELTIPPKGYVQPPRDNAKCACGKTGFVTIRIPGRGAQAFCRACNPK